MDRLNYVSDDTLEKWDEHPKKVKKILNHVKTPSSKKQFQTVVTPISAKTSETKVNHKKMNETLNLKYHQQNNKEIDETETNNSCESLEIDIRDKSEKDFKNNVPRTTQ